MAESASPSGAGDLTGAAERLDALTSYRFDVRLAGSSVLLPGTSAAAGDLTARGTVVLRPQPAARFELQSFAGQPASGLSYVIVGDRSWVKLGSIFVPVPADQGGTTQLLDALRPQNLFLASYGQYLGLLLPAGEEARNGVQAYRFVGTDQAKAAAAQQLGGDPDDWTIEVWVAKEGGYLIAAETSGVVARGGAPGRFEVAIDISGINDPANVVTVPGG